LGITLPNHCKAKDCGKSASLGNKQEKRWFSPKWHKKPMINNKKNYIGHQNKYKIWLDKW
jgi:hypothetical protein